jgi:hypothetical protein
VNNVGGSRPGDEDEAWDGGFWITARRRASSRRAYLKIRRRRRRARVVDVGREAGGCPTMR